MDRNFVFRNGICVTCGFSMAQQYNIDKTQLNPIFYDEQTEYFKEILSLTEWTIAFYS